MKHEYGFSMIKLMIFLAIVGGGIATAMKVFPVYNSYWKIQGVFETVAREKATDSEAEILKRLPQLLSLKYMEDKDVPEGFYDNLLIEADGSHVRLSSSYHVTLWLLGPVSEMDEYGEYEAGSLKGMDIVRHKLRLDFDFEPSSEKN